VNEFLTLFTIKNLCIYVHWRKHKLTNFIWTNWNFVCSGPKWTAFWKMLWNYSKRCFGIL
jgi:hypothetical protein